MIKEGGRKQRVFLAMANPRNKMQAKREQTARFEKCAARCSDRTGGGRAIIHVAFLGIRTKAPEEFAALPCAINLILSASIATSKSATSTARAREKAANRRLIARGAATGTAAYQLFRRRIVRTLTEIANLASGNGLAMCAALANSRTSVSGAAYDRDDYSFSNS